MRSSFLISLALILSIQLVSSQDILGIWSSPLTTYNSDLYCCVPTSITIEAMEGTSNLKATYQFPSIFQQGYSAKCGSFFNGAVGNGGTTTVYKDVSTGQYFIQKYDFYANKNYIFTVSGNTLTVNGAGGSSATTCSFTMNTKSSNSSGGSIVGLLILIIVIVGIIAFKNHQKKQQSAIIAQNLAQNDTSIAYQPLPNTYAAPQQYMYAQPGFVAQPGYVQPGYVAQPGYVQPQMGFVAQPGQPQVQVQAGQPQVQAQVGFAQPGQPQMTMNVNMNANPNNNVNGGVAINVGAGAGPAPQ